jgi:hypothetical protein
MTTFTYDVAPANGYWWVIRTFRDGKFSRLTMHLDQDSAEKELAALRTMVAKQIADARERFKR